jgi:sterol desaturase/sphingolipid hydroxylase (fatty acid hydroxylase superfamily)
LHVLKQPTALYRRGEYPLLHETTLHHHQENQNIMEKQRNPKDSMKSTWRTDKSQWGFSHRVINSLRLNPTNLGEKVAVHSKADKIPFIPNWQLQRFVIVYAFIPIALHQLYVTCTGRNLNAIAVGIFYNIALKFMAVKEIHILRRIGHQYGFLDGDKHERDQVPDHSVRKVLWSLIGTADIRSIFSVMLSYRTSQTPSSINWLVLPLEIGLYAIVLDFWFYWYHRLMHQVDSLWKYHRTHHLTKHPNPLLSLYADTEQDFFDIAGIPLLAYFTMRLVGFPMGFYEWWICQYFIIFTEVFGHSGVRVYSTPPSPLDWALKLCNAELVVEDHDLHHRMGWKKSFNYGKQTRIWDRLFGSCTDRIESLPDNVDYENSIPFPLF